jgi:hypothetical protein
LRANRLKAQLQAPISRQSYIFTAINHCVLI